MKKIIAALLIGLCVVLAHGQSPTLVYSTNGVKQTGGPVGQVTMQIDPLWTGWATLVDTNMVSSATFNGATNILQNNINAKLSIADAGSMAYQNSNNVGIVGGYIDIGSTFYTTTRTLTGNWTVASNLTVLDSLTVNTLIAQTITNVTLQSTNKLDGAGTLLITNVANISVGGVRATTFSAPTSPGFSPPNAAAGSFAYGYASSAGGSNSFAAGVFNTNAADNSFTLGYGLYANGLRQVVVGGYNSIAGSGGSINPTDPVFIVGNGQTSAGRSTAFKVLWNGDATVSSNLTAGLGLNLPTGATSNYFWRCVNAATGAGAWSAVSAGAEGDVFLGTNNTFTATATNTWAGPMLSSAINVHSSLTAFGTNRYVIDGNGFSNTVVVAPFSANGCLACIGNGTMDPRFFIYNKENTKFLSLQFFNSDLYFDMPSAQTTYYRIGGSTAWSVTTTLFDFSAGNIPMKTGKITIGANGVGISNETTVAVTTNFGTVNAGTSATILMSATGAKIGDAVALRIPIAAPFGLTFSRTCATNNGVLFRADNNTLNNIDASAQLVYGADVIGH